jgi:hypothetical protein
VGCLRSWGAGGWLLPSCGARYLGDFLDGGSELWFFHLDGGRRNLGVTCMHGLLERMGQIFSLSAAITFLLMLND